MVDIMYDRQASLGIKPPNEVSIIGCGGVGAWAGIDLALAGVSKITLFDNDKLEIHNLNRVPFRPEDVGKLKTEVLQKFIKKVRPDTTVYVRGLLTDISKSLLRGSVIDCTDALATQQMIFAMCQEKNLLYYRIGYDGKHINVIDGQHKDAPKLAKVWEDGSGQSGYTSVPSWVVPPMVAAALMTEMVCASRPGRDAPINAYIENLMNVNRYMEQLKK